MKSKADRSKPVSVEVKWREAIAGLRAKATDIEKQREAAAEQFPQLEESYRLLCGYVGVLTNRLQLREVQVDFDTPDLPQPLSLPSMSDMICEVHGEDSRRCRCARVKWWQDQLMEQGCCSWESTRLYEPSRAILSR